MAVLPSIEPRPSVASFRARTTTPAGIQRRLLATPLTRTCVDPGVPRLRGARPSPLPSCSPRRSESKPHSDSGPSGTTPVEHEAYLVGRLVFLADMTE